MKRLAPLALILWLFPVGARAQEKDGGASEADSLSAEIDRNGAEALGNDCSIACRALDAMRKATDRLCAVEPGDRCASARDKVKKSIERVRSACPDCGAAQVLTQEAPPPAPGGAEVVASAAPQRGGCAGCATRAPSDVAFESLLFATIVALAARRRRR